jgi:hypothetical protein
MKVDEGQKEDLMIPTHIKDLFMIRNPPADQDLGILGVETK